MIILLIFYMLCIFNCANCLGSKDNLVCKSSDANCSHQLRKSNANCMLKFINTTDCPIYSVGKTYEPFDVPFVLQTYKDKKLKVVVLNLTFPNPTFKSMHFHYRNEWYPQYHLCRSYLLEQHNQSMEEEALFWDCVIFQVTVVEGNFFTLELTDDTGRGGTYSFAIPTSEQKGKDVIRYHSFFYIHKDYFHNTGRLVATILASPFVVVAYNVSLLSCVTNTLNCEQGIPIVSYAIHDAEFISGKQGLAKSVDLGYVSVPGRYAVSVQMVSPDCFGDCAVSFSTVFEIPTNRVLQTIGIIAMLFFVAASCSFVVLLKLKNKHAKHVQKALEDPISVLFVYHPNSPEIYKLLNQLKRFLQAECYALPMLVDDMIGGQNPNQWTEQRMIDAAKVIFFLPVDQSAESATPIKMQYSYALNYFSGCNFPRKGNKFCCVKFPDSESPCKTLYGLKSFSFEDNLAGIITWIHDELFVHQLLYWRTIGKNWSNYQVEDAHSVTASHYSELSNFNGILDEPQTHRLLPVTTPLHGINDRSKIAADFDRDILDVQNVT